MGFCQQNGSFDRSIASRRVCRSWGMVAICRKGWSLFCGKWRRRSQKRRTVFLSLIGPQCYKLYWLAWWLTPSQEKKCMRNWSWLWRSTTTLNHQRFTEISVSHAVRETRIGSQLRLSAAIAHTKMWFQIWHHGRNVESVASMSRTYARTHNMHTHNFTYMYKSYSHMVCYMFQLLIL